MKQTSIYHQDKKVLENEAEQISLAQKDPARFEPLYEKYYRQILGFVYRRAGDRDVAFDITSQVFVNALVNLGKYKNQGVPFSAWLYRIALNELNKNFRQNKIRGVISIEENGLAGIIEVAGKDHDPEDDKILMKAIAKLDEEEVTIIELRFFESRQFGEIAQILGITESTAKQRVYRIIEKIKKSHSKTLKMKREIKKDRPELTEEDFQNGKDFSRVMKGYKRAASGMLWKKAGLSALAVISVAAVVYFFLQPNTGQKENQENLSENYFISPALPGVNIEKTVFRINPAGPDTLEYVTGSRIIIPANAFVDENGNIINTPVELSYREFHDPADFFVAGIPMTYDSAGQTYHFESAGMIEILAFSEGRPVFPNPSALIEVQLASRQTGDYFNIYYLDTVKKNWEYVSEDTAGVKPFTGGTLEFDGGLSAGVPTADPSKYQIKVEFDPEEFPELASIRDVLFETGKSEGLKSADQEWHEIELKRESSGYRLTFFRPGEEISFPVVPVVPAGIKLPKELSVSADTLKKDSIYRKYRNDVIRKRAEDEVLKYAGSAREKEDIIFRSFTVRNFGVWNCDAPQSLPKEKEVFARFINKDSTELKFSKVYLVQTGKNAMYTYYDYYFDKFKYDPGANNVIWGVTPDNKLAVAGIEQVENSKMDGDTCRFVMEIFNNKVKSANDVRSLLKI